MLYIKQFEITNMTYNVRLSLSVVRILYSFQHTVRHWTKMSKFFIPHVSVVPIRVTLTELFRSWWGCDFIFTRFNMAITVTDGWTEL